MILLAWDADTQLIASSATSNSMHIGWAWFVLEESPIAGWLYVQPLIPSEGMAAFAEKVSGYSKTRFNITLPADSVDLTYSAALHDANMLYAHAATKVLSEGGDLHDGYAVTKALRSTTFEGVGKIVVTLDQNGDRIESYEVINYLLDADGAMVRVPVGMYSSKAKQYRAYDQAVVWPGGTTEVPTDYVSGALWIVDHLADLPSIRQVAVLFLQRSPFI